MPEKILGMSRIIISNGRVSGLLCQNVMEKLSVKNGDYYLQYLLIKNGYIIIKRFDAKEAIRQVEETRLKSPLS